jgi:Brp/Blh family beta-carotene 15,15'-monooxygenase
MQKSSILLSFLALWLTSYLSISNQNIIGLCLILSFGILHGANDLIILKKINSKSTSFVKLIGLYIFFVFLTILLFYFLPATILLTFIIVSSYHFGEQNWNLKFINIKSILVFIFILNYGFLMLLGLFYFHRMEVKKIIFEISRFSISDSVFFTFLLGSLVTYLLLSIYFYKIDLLFKKNILEQTFNIIVIFIIYKVSSLIWGFVTYFIFWHSIPSLNDQIKFLYGSSNLLNIKRYFKTAFLYWLVSIIGIFVIYYFSTNKIIFLALFFSLLASITFPHLIVIFKMYQKNK